MCGMYDDSRLVPNPHPSHTYVYPRTRSTAGSEGAVRDTGDDSRESAAADDPLDDTDERRRMCGW
ncbi:hypothetical protein DL89DRAFT_270443 [Linderina pennispora]|uniref:Uncharacterized protein n=1 Tax=Linderina pennispora TaxID=61395 RepID=A0A1Y1VXS7_9FUNG|nr:uncharacterized protein DL89DRAFT_270443 [Linderina pennispora]ORX66057.1 hypothetical protein DL89DRAFT_270443 [Linderina pennispora]